MSDTTDDLARSNEAAWDRAAEKYAPDVDRDLEFLRSGGVSLAESEVRLLGDLSACSRAIHLQCSHGLDTLSLLNLGVVEVVGIDRSEAMLALARQKSVRLGVRAQWVQADVLKVPGTFDGTADLVYTGKGALPWVLDLEAWARVVAELLRPGGRLYIYEGPPPQLGLGPHSFEPSLVTGWPELLRHRAASQRQLPGLGGRALHPARGGPTDSMGASLDHRRGRDRAVHRWSPYPKA